MLSERAVASRLSASGQLQQRIRLPALAGRLERTTPRGEGMQRQTSRFRLGDPRYERAKLDTPGQINEIKKAYRAYRNKKITAADLKNQRDTLVALRAGLPDPVEKPKAMITLRSRSIFSRCHQIVS
jgi:hypothetical protein